MPIKQDNYEKRVVVFIDILGFKQHIEDTQTDKEHFKIIRDALNYIEDLEHENYHGFIRDADVGKEVTIFSDSIVISYPMSLKSAVYYLILEVVQIQMELLAKGILMRGGIAIGELCHKGSIVFGDAMVRAHELESKKAKYPRVLLTKDVLREGAVNSFQHTPREELEYLLNLCGKGNDEEEYFVEYMSQYGEFDFEIDYYNMLKKAKGVIEKNLVRYSGNSEEEQRIREKYEWTKVYYKHVVSGLKEDFVKGLEMD